MRIHPSLFANADMNPTKETSQQTITDLCQSIEDGFLTLPLYQRDLSWTLAKCVDLLNYQLSGKAPVSAISINVINNVDIGTEQVTFIDRELVEKKSGLKSVVDGQQRISTNYKAYVNSPDIVLDISRGKFILLKDGVEIRNNQIPAGILLNKDIKVFNRYITGFKNDIQNILSQIRNKFKTYNYTVNKATDLTEDEQIQWFEVLNNAGSKVTEVQMRLSKLKVMDIDIYTDFTKKFVKKIEEYDFDAVFDKQSTYVSYPMCALNPAYEVINKRKHSNNYCPMAPDVDRINSICNMEPSQIKESFRLTLDALSKALEFIDKNHLASPSRIDYINYLVGYFVFHPESITDSTRRYLIDWYKKTDFSNTSNTQRRLLFSELIKH